MRRTLRGIVVLLVAATTLVAHASTLFSQGLTPNYGGVYTYSATYNYGVNPARDDGWSTFDDFILASNATVNQITFYGVTFSSVDPIGFDIVVNNNFVLDNGNGVPTGYGEDYGGIRQVSTWDQTFITDLTFNTGRTGRLYKYTVNLSSAFSLLGNTNYWLGITARTQAEGQDWLWAPGVESTNTYNYSMMYNWSNGSTPNGFWYENRSFELSGISDGGVVPEPMSTALLGMAATAGWYRIRKRACKTV